MRMLYDVKCHTNFDTYKKNHRMAYNLQRLNFKKGSLNVALNRFLGCA